MRKLVKKLGTVESLRASYEAGPTGYVLYWELTELGVEYTVVAPSLVPVKAGDRLYRGHFLEENATQLRRFRDAATLEPL